MGTPDTAEITGAPGERDAERSELLGRPADAYAQRGSGARHGLAPGIGGEDLFQTTKLSS